MTNICVTENDKELGRRSGELAASLISAAIEKEGGANIILATGSSQFETLNALIKAENIQWSKVTMFHLDEYIGLPLAHKASFRKYLKERFLNKVPALRDVHLINGETDPQEECNRLAKLIRESPIDVALVGIGENGHLAFNDPPADFDTRQPYIIVDLDQACRQQQVNENWFSTVESVPAQAISMSIQQILLSKHIICSVPGIRKAKAVKDCVEGEISNLHPASILQNHPACHLFLDKESSSFLK